MSTTTDPYTGEKEMAYPVTSDGVTRGFKVDWAAGTLTDLKSNKVIAKNIYYADPDPSSSTYGQGYQPFSFSMVGARKVIIPDAGHAGMEPGIRALLVDATDRFRGAV